MMHKKHNSVLANAARLTLCFSFAVFSPVAFADKAPSQESERKRGAADLVYYPGFDGHLGGWLIQRMGQGDPSTVNSASKEESLPKSLMSSEWKTIFTKTPWLMIERTAKKESVWLALVIRAEKSKDVLLSLGSDDGIKVVLNQRCIWESTVKRRADIDTDLIDLPLVKGDNSLLFKLSRDGPGYWRVIARLMDIDYSPAKEVRIVLPRSATDSKHLLESFGQFHLKKRVDLAQKKVNWKLTLEFLAGIPAGIRVPVVLSFDGTQKEAMLSSQERPESFEIELFNQTVEINSRPLPHEVLLRYANRKQQFALGFAREDVLTLAGLQSSLRSARARSSSSILNGVFWRVEHLVKFMEGGTVDPEYVRREIAQTEAMVSRVVRGEEPLAQLSGVLRLGYRSSVDGKLHGYVLYLPPNWQHRGDKGELGLVVGLHGYLGTPMKALLDICGQPLLPGMDRGQRDRHPPPIEDVPFFIVAPDGFGASGYRGFGEVDVVEVIEEVLGRFPIDRSRVYITGMSMGGYGAAAMALHFPDVFALAAPLGGYHNAFLYREARNHDVQPWEYFLASEFSNRDWALNGASTPMYIVHGKKDAPRFSRSLAQAYEELGYPVQFETPNLGHNVWDQTYRSGKIFQVFSTAKGAGPPRKVSFVTGRVRYSKSHWVMLTDLVAYDEWARVDAEWSSENNILVETKNVQEMAILDEPLLRGDQAITIAIDGEIVGTFGSQDMWTLDLSHYGLGLAPSEGRGLIFHRAEDGRWYLGRKDPCPSICKRPGLSGPLDDAFYGPLLFVYGTEVESETVLARHMAVRLSKPRFHISVDWPVKADKDVTEQDISKYSLVLVGTPEGNSLLGKIMTRLPIRVDREAVWLDGTKYVGNTVAASFIYPNPLAPERYVVVHTGVSERALYYVDHLPRFVPDYLIYDASGWRFKDGRFFAGRRVLRGGFFDADWRVSSRSEECEYRD